ncbi:MAG: hypothetical protein ACRET2_17880, partial [Steroidobacteraceae bacterium]
MASLAAYRLEVGKLDGALRTRTLQEQAREFLAGMRVHNDGTVEFDVPSAWRQAYADASGRFAYTLYDAARHPIAFSPNLIAPLPFSAVPSGKPYAPIGFIGAGPKQRAVIAARAPKGYVLVVARRDIGRKTLVDSLFEEASEQLLVLVPFAILAL